MEDALARHFLELGRNEDVVLILVVMEDALALDITDEVYSLLYSLNPCCNGRCTRTLKVFPLST